MKNPKLMTESEIKAFIDHLLTTAEYGTYETTGLMFMFHSFGILCIHDKNAFGNLCDDLASFVFTNSYFAGIIEDIHLSTIPERFRQTDWAQADSEINLGICAEIEQAFEREAEEKPLDLSAHPTKEDECLDLAKHFSAILADPKTPVRLYDAIADELANLGNETQRSTVESPEYIAKTLCEELNKVD